MAWPRRAACMAGRIKALPQALDGDELVAGGGAVGHRNGAGDLVAIDPAEGCRSNVAARLAIGGRYRNPATRPCRKAAVHAIAIGVVGDDEGALFGMSGSAENDRRAAKRAEYAPHRSTPRGLNGSQRNADH